MVLSTGPYTIPKNGCRLFPQICPAPTAAKNAHRKPRSVAMCRWCDALGPICRYVTDPGFAETTAKGVPYVPPYPDDLLAEELADSSSVASSEDEQQQPRTPRPTGSQPRNNAGNTGASRPNPAVSPVSLQ